MAKPSSDKKTRRFPPFGVLVGFAMVVIGSALGILDSPYPEVETHHESNMVVLVVLAAFALALSRLPKATVAMTVICLLLASSPAIYLSRAFELDPIRFGLLENPIVCGDGVPFVTGGALLMLVDYVRVSWVARFAPKDPR
jgi:hypothetical protein